MTHNIFRIVLLVLCIAYLTHPVKAGVMVGVNNLSVVYKSSNGVTIAFPDVCKTPASPSPSVPVPYPNIAVSETKKGNTKTKTGGGKINTKTNTGDIITYTLYGDSLENIISAEVCTGCLKNNNFKTTYIFISSQHDKWIYKKPYIKDGNIWLEGVEKNPSSAPHFSAWVFYVPKNIHLK